MDLLIEEKDQCSCVYIEIQVCETLPEMEFLVKPTNRSQIEIKFIKEVLHSTARLANAWAEPISTVKDCL